MGLLIAGEADTVGAGARRSPLVMGLVEGGRKGLVLLEEAGDVVSDSPAKLEHARARTEVVLHRASRRSEACAHLRQALDLPML
jgi:hypothetical protein